MSARRYALVAGGGTAGHVLPAVAVAHALTAARGPGSVEIVGSHRGMEATLLAGGDLPFTLLPGRGIIRSFDRSAWSANLRAVGGLAGALVSALALVGRRRPAVVVSVGGYASVPPALAALMLGVPVVLLNVDAVPGTANRLLGRFARASAVAYPGTRLPRAVVTGPPVRPDVASSGGTDGPARYRARRALGVPEAGVVVAVFGGSLGARRLNEAALDLARRWEGTPGRAIYHVVGRRNAGRQPPPPVPAAPSYRCIPYEDRMGLLYQAADIAVCRAGAMTVAELAAVGLPSVLVPLPGAPGDHQTANARIMVEAGAAVLLADQLCTGERLARELQSLLAEPGRLAAMGDAARSLARADAATAVAVLAEVHARPRAAVASTGAPA